MQALTPKHTIVAALTLLMLTGCVSAADTPPPSPADTFSAPYATEEEALAAAEEAYAEYIKAINFHLQESIYDEELLANVSTGGELDDARDSYSRFSKSGNRTVGDVIFGDMTIQRYSLDSSTSEVITVYVCDDLSAAHLVDSSGARIHEEEFAPYTSQVTFDYLPALERLLVSDRIKWSDEC